MKLDALAGHLRDRSETILQRWRDDVRRDPSQPACRRNLTGAMLDDHLPSLLRMLVHTLCEEDTPLVDREGAEHGHQRRVVGYTITELHEEMIVFRQHVMRGLDEFLVEQPGVPTEQVAVGRSRLLDLLDRSLKASVGKYAEEAESERDAARVLLELKNRELNDANAQKDRFLTMLSHELRTPLSPILTAVQILRRRGIDDPRVTGPRDIIERQARYLAKLVDDLLDVSRIEHGKIELTREVLDVQDAVQLAIESCRPAIDAKDHDLRVQVPQEPLLVVADRTRLTQVVSNLLMNATKYTPSGGHIAIAIARENDEAVIRVADTGIGINPDMLSRVFDVFTQADTSMDRRSGGLGIGLMVARNLVEMQGGRVEARSEGLGRGAELVIRLPLASAGATPQHVAEAPARPQTPPIAKLVVVVEDDPDAREALEVALDLLGHHVLQASSPESAVEIAREQRPDVFIVDIGLPGMNGYDLARVLRGLPGGRDAMLIALTGYGSETDRERAEEAGFDFHVTKPAEVDELEALLAGPMPARPRSR